MIELEGIEAKQGDFRLAVEKLRLKQGDFVAVLGNNGSGKSTFFALLSGILKSSGDYNLGGRDFYSMSLLDRNRLIGLLPQRTTLNMPFDVHYVILTGRFPYTDGYNYSKNDFEVTDEVISKFDIEHLRKRQFNELSGGEKQRVLLARILNRDTPVMLLDEPLTGIDLRHQLETIELLKNLRQEKLIMVVMHDISLAIREFDRFLFFTEGRLIYNEEADEINESNLSEIFQVQVKFIRDQEKLFIHTEL